MMRATTLVFAAAFLCAGSLSSLAIAQDVATAEALFNKGLSDMEAGKFDTGCPSLNESYRLDPRPGTLFTLAECYAKAGKLATAVSRYEDYLSLFSRLPPDQQAKQNGRDKKAADQKAALAPLVPQLTVNLPKDAPAGTTVKRDDTLLTGPSIGLPLPVDPGDHLVTTTTPSGGVVEKRFSMAKGEKKVLDLEIKLGEQPIGQPGNALPLPAGGDQPDASSSNGQRIGAFVAFGIGGAGLIAGGITGALALGKKSTVDANCDANKVCNAQGKSAADSGKTLGLMSTIGFIVGGVGLATGTVLFVTAKSRAKPQVGLGILDAGPAGAVLGSRGTF